ncbi:MAG: hypothetical protein RMK18_12265, partial [Armatimonadota bacterium]|nr:hypothetical protein [Armatimonadota bacterium]
RALSSKEFVVRHGAKLSAVKMGQGTRDMEHGARDKLRRHFANAWWLTTSIVVKGVRSQARSEA